jgi:hypothetical protein
VPETDGTAVSMGESWLVLSLHDAANNCRDHYALARVYLRGGQVLDGVIDWEYKEHLKDTVHMRTGPGGTGWATLLTSEIIAVEVRRP